MWCTYAKREGGDGGTSERCMPKRTACCTVLCLHRLQGGSFTAVPIDRDTLLRAGPEEKLLLPTSETRSFKVGWRWQAFASCWARGLWWGGLESHGCSARPRESCCDWVVNVHYWSHVLYCACAALS